MKDAPLPADPVFIVGHWRTGSTYLHQLMSLDDDFIAPTLFQVALPEHFLVSRAFYKPIFSSIMGTSRPMDNVHIGMDEPQEDEYALFRLTGFSPLSHLVFPRKQGYFLEHTKFTPDPPTLAEYEKELSLFFKKLHFISGKRIVSKNPFNSFRIPLLVKLFPKAQFIHIVRHPYAVVPSTDNLWQILQRQNRLNRQDPLSDLEAITIFLERLTTTVQSEFSRLPAGRKFEVRYEDLEADPVGTLRSVYAALQITFSTGTEINVGRFLVENAGFRKNRYLLSPAEKKMIGKIMSHHMNRYLYPENV
jgi:hypothetical protein